MQVLIIGASRGIGLELVHQYRADGAAVTAYVDGTPLAW
jgi:NAD(P)-dependent dehydrogenase (short-subunit alcohol dehydrogenase family)